LIWGAKKGLPFHGDFRRHPTCHLTDAWAAPIFLAGRRDETEPADHDIAPRKWAKLPGGHVLYYHHAENYGALGFIALDTNLTWTGIGSRAFVAEKDAGETAVAISFPQWHGGAPNWRGGANTAFFGNRF